MDRDGSRSVTFLRWLWYGLLLVPLLFMGLFFLYPLLTIFDLSLRPEGSWDLSGFTQIITSAYYRDTLIFTIWQATLSTLFTIILALPGAYVFTRFDFPAKSFVLSLVNLPFVLPTVVVAAAFSALIGTRGIVNQGLMNMFSLDSAPIQLERTLAIILIVHVFYNYSIALRMIASYWANQSTRIEDAARVLGANGWRLWWNVRLPMLRPAIFAAAILVFIFTFTSFGVVLILGGIQFATLEVQIYYQARNIFNLPLAAALSLVQIAIMFGMMLVYTWLQRRITRIDLQSSRQIARKPKTAGELLFLIVNLSLMMVLLFTPLLALLYRSLVREGTFTLEYYTALSTNTRNSVLFVPPIEAIANSLQFALITTITALFLGILTTYLIAGKGISEKLSRWLDPLFMLPLATSAVTLGFGFIIALDTPPLDLRASVWLIPIAHTLVAMPFVVRSILPALRSIPTHVQESAAVLGAPPHRVWLAIDLPLISRGLIVGATFAFTVSMGEFGASLFVARPDMPTMPLVIFRLLGQPGATNYGQALAMSSILMMVSAVSFITIERVRSAGIGEF
jgi:thiamine transport system permease protein